MHLVAYYDLKVRINQFYETKYLKARLSNSNVALLCYEELHTQRKDTKKKKKKKYADHPTWVAYRVV